MAKFSQRSLDQLHTTAPELQELFSEVIKHFDCTILEGYRSEAKQNEAFRRGLSKLKYPNSRHNRQPSMAVDVAPYPIDWNNKNRFYYFAGFVKATAKHMGIKVRWGGDWDSDNDINDQSFIDLPHWELA